MRWTIALFAFALIAMQIELWFSDDRRPGLRALELEVAAQSATNAELVRQNAELRAEIVNLRDGNEAAEERARSELGLVRPDETFFQIGNVDVPPAPE
ncbi:MAG: septum formation initiator family protein [Gammaproteobacteria bacterium]|jgi:cell division protein FtsB